MGRREHEGEGDDMLGGEVGGYVEEDDSFCCNRRV